MPWNQFSPTVRLLTLIGSARPEFFDVFPPHGLRGGPGDLVAVSPQPLPSKGEFVAGAVAMARRLGALAVEADVRGENSAAWLSEIIDDWCGTPWPRKWPWPGPGPHPVDGPQPEPWLVNVGRASGSVVFATLAGQLGEGSLQEVLARGADKLAASAVEGL